MKIKTKPGEIWKEYQRGISYKEQYDIYDIVERNENFYNDKQWEDVIAPNMPKPVLNFLKPVVNHYVAMLVSDEIATNVELMDILPEMDESGHPNEDSPAVRIPRLITTEVANIMERANVYFKNRRAIRNCAVDGDACFYTWFDPDAETGSDYKGEIKVDVINNTNVYFGDPSTADVEEQPYIIIAYRRLTTEVKEEAEANGINPEEVLPDSDNLYMNSEKDADNQYTTVLLKLWKEGNDRATVHMTKCTQTVVIKKAVDTEYRLYPVSWINWEAVKNSYHGVAPITHKIENQIYVNKLYGMALLHAQKNAFPTTLYNKNILPNGIDTTPGAVIAVDGDPREVTIFDSWKSPEASNIGIEMANLTMQHTKELMGGGDAALGNVNPDNTSAIIAVQQAAALPLDVQRLDFYNFVESYIRIFVDIMRVNYGERPIVIRNENGDKAIEAFDFAEMDNYALQLNIDIGKAAAWSEQAHAQTLDNLLATDRISLLTYFETMPKGLLPSRDKLIADEKAKQEQAAQAMMAEQAMQQMPLMAEQEQGMDIEMEQAAMEGQAQAKMDAFLQELLILQPETAEMAINESSFSDEEKAMLFQAYQEQKGAQDVL